MVPLEPKNLVRGTLGRQVCRPVGEQVADGAALEFEGRRGHVFGTIQHVRLDRLADSAHSRFYVARVVTQEIDVVNADHHEDAAAGHRLVPSPVAYSVASDSPSAPSLDGMCLDSLDRAQGALVEHALHGLRLQRMTQVLSDQSGVTPALSAAAIICRHSVE